jgi:hypothetical protein
MDAKEIQDLIDRLEALKKRHVELIDEQIRLTKKIAEGVSQNDQARDFQAGQRDRATRDQEARKQARRDVG